MKNIKVTENKYDWAVFASSFLLISKLACQELLNKNESKYSKNQTLYLPYTAPDLFVSILFNIKHGIEVFIKTLSIFAYGEYTESHDIQDLFMDAKNKIKEIKLKPIKINGNEISQEDVDNLPVDLEKIEEQVKYFFNLDFLKEKIGAYYTISDKQNDVFRYPDNKASVRINWDVILSNKINEADISELQGRVDCIYELFTQKGYLFSVIDEYRAHSKIQTTPESLR